MRKPLIIGLAVAVVVALAMASVSSKINLGHATLASATSDDSTMPYQSAFQNGTVGWFGVNGPSVATSTAQFRTGAVSLAVTSAGSGGSAGSPHIAVGQGTSVTGSAWVRAAVTPRPNMAAALYAYGSDWTQLASVDGSKTASTNSGWTQVSVNMMTPPGTAFVMFFVFNADGNDANGDVFYIDDVAIIHPGAAASYGAQTLPSHPTGATYQVPASIKSDCTTNVTKELNDVLTLLPDNSTLAFPAGGCYHSEGVLFVDGKHNIALAGNGAQIVARTDGSGLTPQTRRDLGNLAIRWPEQRKHLVIMNDTNVTITGFVLHGPNHTGIWNPPLGDQSALLVMNSTGVLIDGNREDHVYGDFVSVVGTSSQVTIQNNIWDAAGRECVGIGAGSYLTIRHNTMTGCRLNVDDEPLLASFTSEHVLITDNDITGGTFFSNVGDLGATTGDIELSFNHLHGAPIRVQVGGAGIGNAKVLRHHYRIIGNTSDFVLLAGRGAIVLNSVDDALVQGNTEPFQAVLGKGQWTQAVVISNSTNVIVTGNSFGAVSQNLAPGNSSMGEASTTLSVSAATGTSTLTIAGHIPSLEIFRLGSGATAELITAPHGCGTSPCTFTLSQPLIYSHYAGESFISAPNSSG